MTGAKCDADVKKIRRRRAALSVRASRVVVETVKRCGSASGGLNAR
jgi:hypothetical protein